jgi:two-component system chemotaxis sensor kinase CheA
MSVQLSQYRELYFSEAREKLASIAAALRKLERAPGEQAAFDAAFRATHTLKGMSATMGYDEITVFAHAFEDLLESARDHSDGVSNADIYPLFIPSIT